MFWACLEWPFEELHVLALLPWIDFFSPWNCYFTRTCWFSAAGAQKSKGRVIAGFPLQFRNFVAILEHIMFCGCIALCSIPLILLMVYVKSSMKDFFQYKHISLLSGGSRKKLSSLDPKKQDKTSFCNCSFICWQAVKLHKLSKIHHLTTQWDQTSFRFMWSKVEFHLSSFQHT